MFSKCMQCTESDFLGGKKKEIKKKKIRYLILGKMELWPPSENVLLFNL